MNKTKWFVAFIALSIALVMISCGDDENPAGPGDNPTASVLTATSGTLNSVAAVWTMCPDNDFSEYNLYRSATSGISASPPSSPIKTATNAEDTTYTDIGLTWGETYYYALQTKNDDDNTAWSNEVQVVIADSGSSSGYLTCYEIQGQQSASPYEGLEVDVTGIVTVGGDEYYSSSGPVAVLGDPAGGPWTGLILFGDSIASLARGDSIIISGTVQEFYGATELTNISAVEVITTGNDLPPSTAVSTSSLSASQDPEQYESVLVSISNGIVTEVLTYGEFLVDDGSGACRIDDMGNFTYSPTVGDTIFTGTGTMWYNYDEWMLEPRDNNDLVTSGGGGGGAYTCYEIQGQASSSPFDGQTVSVTGIITADPDDYTATSSTYSVISDADGGPWSGLLMYSSDLAGLQRGDSVTVTGVVDEYFGMTELKYPLSYVVHSSGHALPNPEQMSTGDLATSTDPEQWESVFVTVSDVDVTQIGLPYYTWAVDDGSGECYAGTMGDFTYTPVVGNSLSSMTGVLWYSYDYFKIQPRDDSDIVN